MAFTVPRFEEGGESEIIDNLLEVTHRDMKRSLDYFNLDTPTYLTRYGVSNFVGASGEDLPDFAVMTQEEDTSFLYPLLVLGLERMESPEHVSGEYLQQDLIVGAGIVVKDSSIKNVKRKATKYVRAFKAVVRAAEHSDLFPGNDADFLDHVVDINHRYLRHAQKGEEFTQPVEIELRFRFGET